MYTQPVCVDNNEGIFLIYCRKSLLIQFLVIGITISGWCGWFLISCLS